jgi:hypothetical protein
VNSVPSLDRKAELMNSLNDEVRAQAEIATARLRGGPVDGWLVKPDADVLEVDWP